MTALVVIGSILAYFGVGVVAARFGANNVYKHGNEYGLNTKEENALWVAGLMFFFWPLFTFGHVGWLVLNAHGSVVSEFLMPEKRRERERWQEVNALTNLSWEMRQAGEDDLADTLAEKARKLGERR